MSYQHTIIGEALRVSTFFTSFVADKYEHGAAMVEATTDRIEWAEGVMAEWENREQRRGRPWDRALEAAAILGSDKFRNNPYAEQVVEFHQVETAVAYEAALISLMQKASKVERIGEAAGRDGDELRMAQAETILDAQSALAKQMIEDLRDEVGIVLWRQWKDNDGKSHLDGVTAAIRANRGTAWTSSRKGYATTIRYDESADHAPTTKRHAIDAGTFHDLDEDALAELAEEAALAEVG